MANLIRSARSCREWTTNDLVAYNITIESQDVPTFFGQPELPQLAVHPELLTTQFVTHAIMMDKECFRVLRYMDLAMDIVPEEESAVVDFTKQLLQTIGYCSRGRILRSRKDIPLCICGMWTHAKTDVCIMDQDDDILLLVQEDKHHLVVGDPMPQLIAEAIGAVQMNNIRRKTALNLPPLEFRLMAGITMIGTFPTFFKIPVTSELLQAIELGNYPVMPTIVAMHVPDIPHPTSHLPSQ